MKIKFYFTILFSIIFYIHLFAQMNYQFVMLNSNNEPYETTLLSVQLKIRLGSATGNIAYQETHSVITDEFGRANLAIGLGTPVIGTYSGITRSGLHFLDVEVDVNGGNSYQTFSNSQIYPAFKANEIDPLYSLSPASSITQTNINQWNATGGIGVALNSANFTVDNVGNDDVVNISGTISLSNDYSVLNNTKLFITGGKLIGTSGQLISIGGSSVISGVEFENVQISGNFLQFINCKFTNVTRLPNEATIFGGTISNSIIQDVSSYSFCNFNNVAISSCTIPNPKSIVNCNLNLTSIGNASSFSCPNISNCRIDECTIYTSELFMDNTVTSSNIIIKDNVAFSRIEGCKFDEPLNAGNYILTINRTGTAAQRQVKVSGCQFWGESNSAKHVQINGTYTPASFDSIIQFTGNSFTRGTQAFENNSVNTILVISNSVTNSLSSLGVTASTSVYLTDNINIP